MHIKTMMIEDEYDLTDERLSDKYVCTEHFEDCYINKWIEDNGNRGTCTYCSRTVVPVVNMHAFIDFVRSKLSGRFCPIDDAGLFLASSFYDDEDEEIPGFHRVGPFIAPTYPEQYEDTVDMLCAYGLETSDSNLNSDIISCFNDNQWIKNDFFKEDLNEEFSRKWNSFVEIVKHQRRYTFFCSPQFVPQEEWRGDILTEIKELCESILLRLIPVGFIIYRGRPNEDLASCFSDFSDLTSPPSKYAKSNRMSAEGISLFYGAFDEDTVLREIKNYCNPMSIDVGEFSVTKALSVVDLSNIPSKLSFWMPKYYEEYKFLHKFHDNITHPSSIEDEQIYIPTQVFTEYLRYLSRGPIDGIVYQSSLTGKKMLYSFTTIILLLRLLVFKNLKKNIINR